jgi:hypothetical protein
LKFINLSRNILGNKTANAIASALRNDEYIRGVSLRKNKIGEIGINELIQVC